MLIAHLSMKVTVYKILASARDFVRVSCCLCQRQRDRQNLRSEKSITQLQEPGKKNGFWPVEYKNIHRHRKSVLNCYRLYYVEEIPAYVIL